MATVPFIALGREFVMIKFKGVKPHKGFLLEKDVACESSIIVLTGRNGSGKTRFIESIKNLSSEVCWNGEVLAVDDIALVSQAELIGQLREGRDAAETEANLKGAINWFHGDRKLFVDPYDKNNYDRNQSRYTLYTAEQLHPAFEYVAVKANKNVSDLTSEDIKLHFVEPVSLFGGLWVASISNQYMKRKLHNRYCMWRKKDLGHDVGFIPEEDFENVFGKAPWVLFNDVLIEVFEGKFYIDFPPDDFFEVEYKAELKITATGEAILDDSLSSGEKTLLWLTVILFNIHYRDTPRKLYPKLLLLDEPDATLHPKMVLKLYKILTLFTESFSSVVMFTTHSPTTVALFSGADLFVIHESGLNRIGKDQAISELLDGITQLSIDPENQREVFVENQYDVDVYKFLFSRLRGHSPILSRGVPLIFLPSGPKVAPQHLRDNLSKYFNDLRPEDVEAFVLSINGGGDYGQVTGRVDSLLASGSRTVRGVVDWDLGNEPCKGVVVMGYEYAYTLENIMLDPVVVIYELHNLDPEQYSMESFCGKEIGVREWLGDIQLLQASVDKFIFTVLGRSSERDENLVYLSGCRLKTDRQYMRHDGHALQRVILDKYQCLLRHKANLPYQMAKVMAIHLDCQFVPKCVETAFAKLQE